MTSKVKKLVLSGLMIFTLMTLTLPWVNYSNTKEVPGTLILSKYTEVCLLVLGLYFLSVWLYELWKPGLFMVGLACLCVLLGIMIVQIAAWGAPSLKCLGPYLGVGSVVLNLVSYVLLQRDALAGMRRHPA